MIKYLFIILIILYYEKFIKLLKIIKLLCSCIVFYIYYKLNNKYSYYLSLNLYNNIISNG